MDYTAPSRPVLRVKMSIEMEMKQLLLSILGLEVEAGSRMGGQATNNKQGVR